MFTVTDRAALELKKLVVEQGEEQAAVRVFVQGACGCGAANYGMGLEDEIGEEESVLESCGVRFVVDPDSAPYLEGAEIDFRDELMGRGFMIRNPNQQGGGCGCGH
jgi:iron-sulfur cluster assembly protein